MSVKFFISTQVNEIKTIHVKWSCTQLSLEKCITTRVQHKILSILLSICHILTLSCTKHVEGSQNQICFSLQSTKYQYGHSPGTTLTAFTLSLVLMNRNHMGGQCPLWTLFLWLEQEIHASMMKIERFRKCIQHFSSLVNYSSHNQ